MLKKNSIHQALHLLDFYYNFLHYHQLIKKWNGLTLGVEEGEETALLLADG